MESIFMTECGIVRQLTINCSLGVSTKVTDNPRLVHWAPILKALQVPNAHTWLRVDYWTSAHTREHPRLNEYSTPNFDLTPSPYDRLVSATIVPSNLVFELTEPDHPEKGFKFDAAKIKLSARCNGRPRQWSTCGMIQLFPTGQLEIVVA